MFTYHKRRAEDIASIVKNYIYSDENEAVKFGEEFTAIPARYLKSLSEVVLYGDKAPDET